MDKETYLPNWIKDNLIGILLIFVLIFNNNIWLMYAGFISLGIYLTTTFKYIMNEGYGSDELYLLISTGISILIGCIIGIPLGILVFKFSPLYIFFLSLAIITLIDNIVTKIVHRFTNDDDYFGIDDEFDETLMIYLECLFSAVLCCLGILLNFDFFINISFVGIGCGIGVLFSSVSDWIINFIDGNNHIDSNLLKKLFVIIGIVIFTVLVFILSFVILKIDLKTSLLIMGFCGCAFVACFYTFTGATRAILASSTLILAVLYLLGYDVFWFIVGIVAVEVILDVVRFFKDLDYDSSLYMIGFNIFTIAGALILGAIASLTNYCDGVFAGLVVFMILEYVAGAIVSIEKISDEEYFG